MQQESLEQLALRVIAEIEHQGESALEAACTARPEQADELRRLLGHLDRAGLVEDGVSFPLEFKDYELIRRLGTGGMGEVYLAVDRLGRRVALKVLRADLLRSPKAIARLEREARVLAELEHPGICTVYEARTDPRPAFLAMRFLPGGSMADLLDRKRSQILDQRRTVTREDTSAAVGWTSLIARALHLAHEHGIVHRDVKPANIMFDGTGQPVVVDFGLARYETAAPPTLTVAGALLGTPAYMAPEQLEPGSASIDRRVDVYGLGVTLYELLALDLPFRGGTREALYRQILAGSRKDPRRSNPHIGPELHAVLAKAMARDPRDRFASTAELADELERISRRETILTRRPSLALRTRRWIERNPAQAIALAIVSAALALSLSLLARNSSLSDANRARALAELARTTANSDPKLALQFAAEASEISHEPAVLNRIQPVLAVRRPLWSVEIGSLVERVSWSPDGERFATFAGDKKGRVFDSDGNQVSVIDEGGVSQLAVQFSPDNQILALGSTRGVLLFDRDGAPRGKLEVPANVPSWNTRAIDFSPDGTCLVSGSDTGSVWLWNLVSGAGRALTSGDEFPVSRVTFHPQGSAFVSGLGGTAFAPRQPTRPYTLRIWDAAGKAISEVSAHERPISALASGTKCFASASFDGTVRFWSWVGERIGEAGDPTCQFSTVSADSDGRRFVSSSASGWIRVHDELGSVVSEWHRPTRYLRARFSRKGDIIFSADHWGVIRTWSLTGVEREAWTAHEASGRDLAESPTRGVLLSSSLDGSIRCWSTGGRVGTTVRAHRSECSLERLGGGIVTRSDAGGEVKTWTEAGVLVSMLEDAPSSVWRALGESSRRYVAFTEAPTADRSVRVQVLTSVDTSSSTVIKLPANSTMAVPDATGEGVYFALNGTLCRTEIRGENEPEILSELPEGLRRVFALQVNRQGTVIAVGGNNRLGLVNLESRPHTRVLRGHHAWVLAFQFSADDRELFSCSADGTACRWSVATGDCLTTYDGHRGAVRSIDLSPSGDELLTTSIDGTARVWNVATGELLMLFEPLDRKPLLGGRFIESGLRAVTANTDGQLHWWWLRPTDVAEGLKSQRVPALTQRQRRQSSVRDVLGR